MQQSLSSYAKYRKYSTSQSWVRNSGDWVLAAHNGSYGFEEVIVYNLTVQPTTGDVSWDFQLWGHCPATASPFYTTLTLYSNKTTSTSWPSSSWHTANSLETTTFNNYTENASNSFVSNRMINAKHFAVKISNLGLSSAIQWLSSCKPTTIYYSTADFQV